MIIFLNEQTCTDCNQCVVTCPRDVFDASEGRPVIARPEDCQTCFLCELYCKADAIYVDPFVSSVPKECTVAISIPDLSGEYRRESGWDEWAEDERYSNQHWRMEEVFKRARKV